METPVIDHDAHMNDDQDVSYAAAVDLLSLMIKSRRVDTPQSPNHYLPLLPWPLVTDTETDANIFDASIVSHYLSHSRWRETKFSDLVANTYDKVGIKPTDATRCKLPDSAATDQENKFVALMPGWSESNWFKTKETPPTLPLDIMAISRILATTLSYPSNGLTGVYANKAPARGRSTRDDSFTDMLERRDVDVARKQVVALVASQILSNRHDLRRAIPVRMNQAGCKPSTGDYEPTVSSSTQASIAPDHLAIYLEFDDGYTTMLPISVDLLGSRSRPYLLAVASANVTEDSRTFLSGASYISWGKATSLALRNLFSGFPLLTVTDQILLHPVPPGRERESSDCIARSTYIKDDLDTFAPRYLLPRGD